MTAALGSVPPGASGATGPEKPRVPLQDDRRPGLARLVGFGALFLGVAVGLAVFSAYPWSAAPPDAALLKVSVKHVAAPLAAGVALSHEELEKLPRHMRPTGGQGGDSRGRRDTIVRVTLDGRPVLDRTYQASGFRRDGPTFVYEEVALSPGRHRLEATLAEMGEAPKRHDAAAPLERRLEADVEVASRQVLLLELSAERELTLRR